MKGFLGIYMVFMGFYRVHVPKRPKYILFGYGSSHYFQYYFLGSPNISMPCCTQKRLILMIKGPVEGCGFPPPRFGALGNCRAGFPVVGTKEARGSSEVLWVF